VESIWFGGTQSTITNEGAPNSIGTYLDYVFYVFSRNGTALFMDGKAADLCIWIPSSPIDGADAAALAGGARAISVRTSEIAYYWPIAGGEAPEPAFIGDIDLTVSGATYVDDPPALDPVPGFEAFEGEASRTSDTTATISWDEPFGADYGITILRASGPHTEDGSGDEFGDVGYDPSTIVGSTVIAEGESSPYVDTGLDAETSYTYFLVRTGPDA
jgi:hypothetical protein